jgi:hypothetical protein
MKRHHFKLQFRHVNCESLTITCLDPEYEGRDTEYFKGTENNELHPDDLDDLEVEGFDISFSLPKSFDTSHPVFEKCGEYGLDPDEVAEPCLQLAKAERETQQQFATSQRENKSSSSLAKHSDEI